MAVDDQSEICFSIPRGTLLRKPFLLVLSTELIFCHASVTAGWANFGLCPYSTCGICCMLSIN